MFHEEDCVPVSAGIRHLFRQRDMILLLTIFFLGLGIFNAVTTWIEQILSPRGFDCEQAGLVGAVIPPVLSDRMQKRKPFPIITAAGTVPGIAGLAFATGLPMLLLSGFVLGFFIMSAGPLGFQYGAEISYPWSF